MGAGLAFARGASSPSTGPLPAGHCDAFAAPLPEVHFVPATRASPEALRRTPATFLRRALGLVRGASRPLVCGQKNALSVADKPVVLTPSHTVPAPRSGQSNGAVYLFCGKSLAGTRGGTAILDHGKPRGGHRSRGGIAEIDLGNEPPLFADGRSSGMVDRRRVSVRWFVGTVLTGLCGAALMGGAVYAALDREANFAAIPERMEATLRGSLASAERQTVTRKADKLQPVAEAPSAR